MRALSDACKSRPFHENLETGTNSICDIGATKHVQESLGSCGRVTPFGKTATQKKSFFFLNTATVFFFLLSSCDSQKGRRCVSSYICSFCHNATCTLNVLLSFLLHGLKEPLDNIPQASLCFLTDRSAKLHSFPSTQATLEIL